MSDTTTEGRTSPPSSGGQQADREMSDAEVAKEMGDKPPLPKLLSPSRMKDYMQCPKKFHFKSVLRLPDPPGPAAARGTLAHQVLEELFKLPRDQRTVEQAVALVEPEWVKLCADREEYAEMAPPGSELESEVLEFAADVVERYFNIEDPTKFDATELELKLTPKLAKDLRTIGYIDRLDIIEHDDDEFPFITDYKGLALDTPLPTPTGWTTMADVQEGDLLYDADGQPTTVIAKSQVHHRRCYRIEFDDGSHLICDNEHQWQVSHDLDNWKVVDTDALHELVANQIMWVPGTPMAHGGKPRAITGLYLVDSVPTQCVAVDSPDSLYLAGRQMVPTHNTGKLPNPRYMDETWFAMKVYAVMLLAERKQEPFKLRLVYLQGDTPEEAVYTLEVTDALLKHTRKKVLSIWRDMKKRHRNDDWPTKTGPLCDWCAYQDICPAFAPEVDGALAEADPNYRS